MGVTTTKKWLLPALAAVLFTPLLFILVDLILTWAGMTGKPSLRFKDKPYQSGPQGWYELKANFAGLDQYGPYRYPVETDGSGFRKAPQSVPAEQSQIIFLGDSFTYGVNGPWQETFVGMFATDSGLSTLNAAVTSHSPSGYLYRYKKALAGGRLASRHQVIIGLDISDVQDEAGYWIDGPDHPRKSDAELVWRKEANRARSRWQYFQLSKRLYDLVKRWQQSFSNESVVNLPRSAFTYADWQELDREPAYENSLGYAPLGVSGGLQRIEQKLSEIARLARQHEARVWILIYPWPAQLAFADKFSWSSFAARLCRRMQCQGVVDTIARFRNLATQDDAWLKHYYLPGDVHFNRAGNRIIADELLRTVKGP